MNGIEHGHCTPELLEDAARGHLDPARLLEVENHCAACGQCRDVYAAERRIARGTRSWARASLKKRLAETVAQERAAAIPWPRIVAVAAVLLVIAGTGIVYRWLHRMPQEPVILTESVVTDSIATAVQPLAAADNEDYTLPAAAPATHQREKTQAASELSGSTHREHEPALDSRSIPAPAPALNDEIADAAGSLAKSDDATQIIWGTVVADAEDMQDKKGKAARAAEVQQTQIVRNGMGSSEQRALDSRAQGAIGTSAFSVPARVFVVTQQNILAMMRRDAGARPDAVPARVTRTGDTVHIVLLLDTLLPSDALHSATVNKVSADSFQVVLPGRTIGFRLPGGQR